MRGNWGIACLVALMALNLGATEASAYQDPAASAVIAPVLLSGGPAWNLGGVAEGGVPLRPRGGSTTGASLALDPAAGQRWAYLQAPGLTAFERDRRAILAMAGEYRAAFEFVESLSLDAARPQDRPYRSWGTEKVYVVKDTGRLIRLQHVLVMHMVDAQGKALAPIVTKHWRQDWHFEAPSALRYQGRLAWKRQAVPAAARKGAWVQEVWQVDDSPRYGGVGQWRHSLSSSEWQSDTTWRPLPRREFTLRQDYDALVGSNRHVVAPWGWAQEEVNAKWKLAQGAAPARSVGREFGLARYDRVKALDFTPGDRYWAASAPLWSEVRLWWDLKLARGATVKLKAHPDQAHLYMPLFEAADALAEGKAYEAPQARAMVNRTLSGYLAP